MLFLIGLSLYRGLLKMNASVAVPPVMVSPNGVRQISRVPLWIKGVSARTWATRIGHTNVGTRRV